MHTDSPVLDGHGLTPGPAVDERGPSVVMSSADFMRGWSCGRACWASSRGFRGFDIRPSHGTGRLRVSLVPVGVWCGRLWRIDGGGQRAGAARLRFEVAAVASAGYLTPACPAWGWRFRCVQNGGNERNGEFSGHIAQQTA